MKWNSRYIFPTRIFASRAPPYRIGEQSELLHVVIADHKHVETMQLFPVCHVCRYMPYQRKKHRRLLTSDFWLVIQAQRKEEQGRDLSSIADISRNTGLCTLVPAESIRNSPDKMENVKDARGARQSILYHLDFEEMNGSWQAAGEHEGKKSAEPRKHQTCNMVTCI